MKKLLILDNGGETWDRFTIVNLNDGEMIGASEQPFNPLGFGQHCGNVAHNYWVVAYGAGWCRVDDKTLRKRIKYGVQHFQNDCSHVGKKITWEELPEQVQQFAKQSFTN